MMDGISNKMDLQGLSAVRSFAFLTADLMLNITNKNGDNHEYKVTSSHVNNDKLQGPKGILKATKNHAELKNETIASGEKRRLALTNCTFEKYLIESKLAISTISALTVIFT